MRLRARGLAGRGQLRLERLQLGGSLRVLRLAAPLLLLLGLALALRARSVPGSGPRMCHSMNAHPLQYVFNFGLDGAVPAPLRPCARAAGV
jgi:hypothetical protein